MDLTFSLVGGILMFMDKVGGFNVKIFSLSALLLIGLISVLGLIAFAHEINAKFCTETGAYKVCTDLEDYMPESTVHVEGSGFVVNSQLEVKVTRPDGSVVAGDGSFSAWPTDYDRQITDEDGKFHYDYVLDGIVGLYTVEILDQSDNVIATHTFTDSSPKITDVEQADLTPDIIIQGQQKVPLMTFTLRSSDPSEHIKLVKIQYNGTNKADISAMYVYNESNVNSGTFDPAADFRLGSDNSPSSSGEFSVDVNPNMLMKQNVDYQFYVVADIAQTATVGNIVDVKILKDKISFDTGSWPNVSGEVLYNTTGNSLILAKPKLTVTKILIPSNDPGLFNLTIDGQKNASNVTNGGTTGARNVSLGGHIVGETEGAKTNLNNYTSYMGGDCAADGSVTLGPGDNKICTITNVRKANLTVFKVVINDNGGTKVVSDFTLFANGNPVTSGVLNLLANGTYTVSETSDPSYSASFSGDCDSNGNVILTPASNKTCYITNDDIAPKLTVTKIVVNDNGGIKVVSDFPLFVDGNGVASGAENTFNEGAHVVSETADSEYSPAISGDCDENGNVNLALGDIKECTITNDDIAPKLTVTKIVVNNNGGSLNAGDFALFVNNSAVSSGAENELSAGSFKVNETPVFGYSSLMSGNCDADGNIELSLGDVKDCIITNDDIPGKIKVTKYIINDNGGSKTISDFTLLLDDNPVANATETEVSAGDHVANETNVTGYQSTISSDCDANGNVNIGIGEVKECIIYNDDIPSRIIVTKINDTNGDGVKDLGEPGIENWEITLSRVTQEATIVTPIETEIVSLSLTGGNGQVTIPIPTPGHYIVTEHQDPEYAQTFPADSFFDLFVTANDQVITKDSQDNDLAFLNHKLPLVSDEASQDAGTDSVTITWTTDIPATSRVIYDTISHPGLGSAPDYGYAFSTVEDPTKLTSHSVPISGLSPGATYYYRTVSKASPETVGEEFSFTTEDLPKLTVIKYIINDNGGSLDIDAVQLFINDTNVENGSQIILNEGNYKVNETPIQGYVSSISGDCDSEGNIELKGGDLKECIITNDDIAPKLTIIKYVVNDNGGTKHDTDFVFGVDGNQVSNGTQNTYNAGSHVVSEDIDPAYAASFGADCDSSGNVNLNPGDEKICIITNDDIAAASARIIVAKQTMPSSNQAFSFVTNYTDGGFQLKNAQSNDSGPLAPGVYNVTELAATGWNLAGASCNDGSPVDAIDLAGGETVICTFVNSRFLVNLSPAKVWVGLRNSDDVGTKFDLRAEVYKNNTLIGSGQIGGFSGVSSGFNNAKLATIPLNLISPVDFSSDSNLSINVSVRIANNSGHRSGTARLWYNDPPANSRFDAKIGTDESNYYLLNNFTLGTQHGFGPKKSIDVTVDKAKIGNAYKTFGVWKTIIS